MNNYHIYEEIGRGESTVTYKVPSNTYSSKGQKEKNYRIHCSQES